MSKRKQAYWLSDAEWAAIEPHLPKGRSGARRVDDRRVVSGIVHMLRSGARWRDCPAEYGPYTTVYNRFNRWSRRGIFKRVFEKLAAKSRDSVQLIDSTIVKAHRAAAGAKGGRKIKRSASVAAGGRRKSTPTLMARCGR
jgi:transposase